MILKEPTHPNTVDPHEVATEDAQPRPLESITCCQAKIAYLEGLLSNPQYGKSKAVQEALTIFNNKTSYNSPRATAIETKARLFLLMAEVVEANTPDGTIVIDSQVYPDFSETLRTMATEDLKYFWSILAGPASLTGQETSTAYQEHTHHGGREFYLSHPAELHKLIKMEEWTKAKDTLLKNDEQQLSYEQLTGAIEEIELTSRRTGDGLSEAFELLYSAPSKPYADQKKALHATLDIIGEITRENPTTHNSQSPITAALTHRLSAQAKFDLSRLKNEPNHGEERLKLMKDALADMEDSTKYMRTFKSRLELYGDIVPGVSDLADTAEYFLALYSKEYDEEKGRREKTNLARTALGHPDRTEDLAKLPHAA